MRIPREGLELPPPRIFAIIPWSGGGNNESPVTLPEGSLIAYSVSMATQPPPDPADEQGISLEELSQAFAQAMGRRPSAEPPVPEQDPAGESPSDQGVPASQETESPAESAPEIPAAASLDNDDPCEITPQSIFESLLFVGNPGQGVLTAQQASELMRGVEPGEIPDLVAGLNARYAVRGCPYHIVQEEAGYRLTLRSEFHWVRTKFYGRIRETRLSQAAVDVLAIVAYRQPISGPEVSAMRGSPSGALLSQLVRRELLCVSRPSESRTVYYSTTNRFLQLVGMEELSDLPQSDDLETR